MNAEIAAIAEKQIKNNFAAGIDIVGALVPKRLVEVSKYMLWREAHQHFRFIPPPPRTFAFQA